MQLVSYLFFENQAAEAFEFYAKCLGGEIIMKATFGEMPDGDKLPAKVRGQVAHICLQADKATLMASDWCSDKPYPGMSGAAVSLHVDDPANAERLFAALGEGGSVTMPIAETSWARRFGMLTDRYGTQWMVNCDKTN